MEESKHPEMVAADVKIYLRSVLHVVHVTLEDDCAKLAEKFVADNNLRPEALPKIEIELQRAQCDVHNTVRGHLLAELEEFEKCKLECHKFQQRALAAEMHASKLSERINALADLANDIEDKMRHKNEEIAGKNEEIAKLKSELADLTLKHVRLEQQFVEKSLDELNIASPTKLPHPNFHQQPIDTPGYQMIDRLKKLDERNKELKNTVTFLEDENKALIEKYENSAIEYKVTMNSYRALELENSKMEEELRHLRSQTPNRSMSGSSFEQIAKLRENNSKLETKLDHIRYIFSCAFENGHTFENFPPSSSENIYFVVNDQNSGYPQNNDQGPYSTAYTSSSFGGGDGDEGNAPTLDPVMLNEVHNYNATSSTAESPSTPNVSMNLFSPNAPKSTGIYTPMKRSKSPSRTAVVNTMVPDLKVYIEKRMNPTAEDPDLISPMVEDRMIKTIYNRFVADSVHQMNLSRFGRFAREFSIINPRQSSNSLNSTGSNALYLVSGEIDMIFMNASKSITEVQTPSKTFFIRKNSSVSKINAKQSMSTTLKTVAPYISSEQFALTLQMIAEKLYAPVIEQETGTVLECLPSKQRGIMSRAVLDLMFKQKILPTVEKLDLLPWPLVYLDQGVTATSSSLVIPQILQQSCGFLEEGFYFYCVKSMESVKKSASSRNPVNWKNCEDLTTRGLGYKALSRFSHDFGLVPYLLKEPQLHSLFQEVVMWSLSDFSELVNALPEEVRAISRRLHVYNADILTIPVIGSSSAKKLGKTASTPTTTTEVTQNNDMLSFNGFVILLITSSMQAFQDLEPDSRVQKLFDWMNQSGGSLLLRREMDKA